MMRVDKRSVINIVCVCMYIIDSSNENERKIYTHSHIHTCSFAQTHRNTRAIGLSRIKLLVTDLVLCNGQVHGRAFGKTNEEKER